MIQQKKLHLIHILSKPVVTTYSICSFLQPIKRHYTYLYLIYWKERIEQQYGSGWWRLFFSFPGIHEVKPGVNRTAAILPQIQSSVCTPIHSTFHYMFKHRKTINISRCEWQSASSRPEGNVCSPFTFFLLLDKLIQSALAVRAVM